MGKFGAQRIAPEQQLLVLGAQRLRHHEDGTQGLRDFQVDQVRSMEWFAERID